MTPIDWDDGDYARAAEAIVPVAEIVAEAAGVAPGARVADVACGTGNAAFAMAVRGAAVVGVDAAPQLVAQARLRAAQLGLGSDVEFDVGDAEALPLEDAAFDVAVSVFGVIFAPDPARAAAELVRVVRPGGAVVVTDWVPQGPIAEAGRLLGAALGLRRENAARPRSWAELLADAGATESVCLEQRGVPFTAASPEAWFDDQTTYHPAWRAASTLDDTAWRRLRHEAVAVLAAGNEDASAFRTTSRYLLTTARRP